MRGTDAAAGGCSVRARRRTTATVANRASTAEAAIPAALYDMPPPCQAESPVASGTPEAALMVVWRP